MDRLPASLPVIGPTLLALALGLFVLLLVNRVLLKKGPELGPEARLPRQITLLVLTGITTVVVVLTLPVAESTRNQLLGLLGLVLAAVMAFSSTTFVANAMAGLMLRSVGSFRPGDFIRAGEHFGRVTERGLFHVEIQTEDRDLTTLPNMFLVSNPVAVLRSSGTIVSANLSLSYDVNHATVEPLLLEAAQASGLQDPFVQLMDLADFSVAYRVAGFLPDTKQLLTQRSNLRKNVLDALHGAGVEIVSPTFMNQRQLPGELRVIPAPASFREPATVAPAPEDLIFDKAEAAEKLEKLRQTHGRLLEGIKELERRASEARDEAREGLQRELERRKDEVLAIERALERQQREDAG